MDIVRSDYVVTVPEGSIVDAEDPDIDLDHYTSVNLPGGDLLIILALDDKKYGDLEFDKLRSSYTAKVKEPAELPSDMGSARDGKASIVTGKIGGMKFCFESALIPGHQKAVILSCTYEKNHPEQARAVLRQAIESLVINE